MVMEDHCADKELGPKVTLLANPDIYVSSLTAPKVVGTVEGKFH